eukprot:CAMPEP_0114507966 /NCGR_PEP_ID=MMETSP0109-20121206/12320_1 /TAXON_ID=29199 /ORGANISM="Chlorarachnion reptans, Strain CCCM449" /LENGTH=328 /DNA_ID=CAMNT_0001686811 /DNA_START=64 /DNA_END=1050 /DNA_ORIENTATION=+
MGASASTASPGDLRGKVAVITGGASGIGLGVARKCAGFGMKICIVDINSTGLSRATTELIKLGAQSVMAYRCDVSKLLSVWDLKDKVYKEYGEVTFLFNNAGLAGGWSSYNTTKSEWDLVLGVNLSGVINGLSAFVPSMVAQGTPCCVVNTSSVAGLVGANALPYTGAPYVVAKTAVTSLTECLSVELRAKKSQVTAHILMPGYVKTGIFENSEKMLNQSGQRSMLTDMEKKKQTREITKAKENGMTVSEMVDKMYERICRGDFYLVITPPEQPEPAFRALAAVRADDIVRNRAANSISMKPAPEGAHRALRRGVKAAANAMTTRSKL